VTVYLVAGPPAVGKSTVTRLMAEARPRSLLVDVDRIRDTMVVNGGVLPDAEWSPSLVSQLGAARRSACALAHAYDAIGFDVVIDDFFDPHSQLAEYSALDGLEVHRWLLLPAAEEARARNRQRGEGAEYIDQGIALTYDRIPTARELTAAGWRVVDTTELTPELTRDLLLGLA
jgi:hypothetical protein